MEVPMNKSLIVVLKIHPNQLRKLHEIDRRHSSPSLAKARLPDSSKYPIPEHMRMPEVQLEQHVQFGTGDSVVQDSDLTPMQKLMIKSAKESRKQATGDSEAYVLETERNDQLLYHLHQIQLTARKHEMERKAWNQMMKNLEQKEMWTDKPRMELEEELSSKTQEIEALKKENAILKEKLETYNRIEKMVAKRKRSQDLAS